MHKFTLDSIWITKFGLQLKVTNVEQKNRCIPVITFCSINGEDIVIRRNLDECKDLKELPC